jgi:hypothetical protein
MSVAILIEFKDPAREELYVPLATQGVYSSEWLPMARELGLYWVPLFLTGISVSVEDLPVVVQELERLRSGLVGAPGKSPIVQRLDFVLERLRAVDSQEIAELFIG